MAKLSPVLARYGDFLRHSQTLSLIECYKINDKNKCQFLIGNGVVYPNLEHPRMTEYHPGMPRDGADLPFENEDLSNIPASTERVSVSSLSGQPFSRRRYFAQTENYILPGICCTRKISVEKMDPP